MQQNILISEVKFIYWVDVDSINFLVNRKKFHKNIGKYLKNSSKFQKTLQTSSNIV